MPLYNNLDKKALQEKLLKENADRVVASFYRYIKIKSPEVYRDKLYKDFTALGILGRVYVAKEGINAQVSLPKHALDDFLAYIHQSQILKKVYCNFAVEHKNAAFLKLIVKVKNKIVADGLNDKSFDASNTGTYLNADEFNHLTGQKDTILVDMRNHYESEVGHFKNALRPDVDTFAQGLKQTEKLIAGKQDKNIIMYCTGGIRCEKATAYFKHRGFKNMYHLKGGIIKYANDVKQNGLENKFTGKNFVFDDRLGERISEDVIARCHQCNAASDRHVNCQNEACHLLFIQCEKCAEKYDVCCSTTCQDFIKLPQEKQGEIRKGMPAGRNIYHKGRFGKSAFLKHYTPKK